MDSELPDFRAEFSGAVSNDGKLEILDKGRWIGFFMRHAGKRVSVTVTRQKQKRSDNANRYYWGMVVPLLSEVTGYEREEAHEIFKALFLRERIVLPGGEEVERVGSTAALDTKAFADYVEKCCRWLAGHGWYVPQPGEERAAVSL